MMSQQASAQDLVNDLKGRIQQVRRLSALPIQELVLPNGVLDQLAHHLARNLKATQLRRVFHDLKRLEQDAKRGRQSIDRLRTKLALTLPELAYAYGRGKKPPPHPPGGASPPPAMLSRCSRLSPRPSPRG